MHKQGCMRWIDIQYDRPKVDKGGSSSLLHSVNISELQLRV